MSQTQADQEPTRDRVQTKTPRLRSACNQCYVAKVKCTGERYGCARCETLQTDCIYIESRVGRVPGIRSKRKKIEKQQQQHHELAVDQNLADVIVAHPLVPSPKRQPGASSSSQQNPCPWTQTWAPDPSSWGYDVPMLNGVLSNFEDILGENNNDQIGREGNSDVSATEHNTRFTSSGSSRTPSSVVGSPGDDRVRTSIRPQAGAGLDLGTTTLPTPQSVRRSSETQWGPDSDTSVQFERVRSIGASQRPESMESKINFARLDSRCVMVCTHIAAKLENYLLCELKTLDLILEATRKAAEELKHLIALQQPSRCDRFMMLSIVVITQVIDLFEMAAKPPTEENDTGFLDSGGLLSSLPSSFAFGAFSLGVGEQRAWSASIMRKEYRHWIGIVSAVAEMASQGPRGFPLTPAMAEDKTRCLVELRGKLMTMFERESKTGQDDM